MEAVEASGSSSRDQHGERREVPPGADREAPPGRGRRGGDGDGEPWRDRKITK